MKALVFLLMLSTIGLEMYRRNEDFPKQLLSELNQNEVFRKVYSNKEKYRFELIVSFIYRNRFGTPSIETYRTGVDQRYFYPASTVKLPTAVAVLSKIPHNERSRIIQFANGGSCGEIYPSRTVYEHLQKMLLYSDNPSFNALSDISGFNLLNKTLQKAGMRHSRIIKRLLLCNDAVVNHPQYRMSGEKFFRDAALSEVTAYPTPFTHPFVGKGFNSASTKAGHDFSKHNYLRLGDLHNLITRIMVAPKTLPMLNSTDILRLRKLIGATPDLFGDRSSQKDITKILFFARAANRDFKRFYSFNIIGEAYGFLTESAYLCDYETGAEVIISARGYFNENEIVGDDNYEYRTIGYPLWRFLGEYFLEKAKGLNNQPLNEWKRWIDLNLSIDF